MITKKLRLYYLEQSKQYQILFELLTGSNKTADSLVNKLFISRASVYNELKLLKGNLKEYGIKIKNYKIVGPELRVRSFFFSFFSDFYCGLANPFPSELNQKIKSLKKILLVNQNLYPTRVQEYRLELFIGISFIRNGKKFLLLFLVKEFFGGRCMELCDLQNPEEYLNYFNNLVENNFEEKYPNLTLYYKKLCEKFKQVIKDENRNFLLRMRELLLIDAKIQMLNQLKNYNEESSLYEEVEIIEMVEDSQFSYYRELLGKHTNEKIPWMLICMSDLPN